MDDFIGDYDGYLDAVEKVDRIVKASENSYGPQEWGHIYDTKRMEKIYNK